jgi:hypothetical protein
LKKVFLTCALSFLLTSLFAQSDTFSSQRVKSSIIAPDGSVAFNIIDDVKSHTIKLESTMNFYKYQLLNTKTGEPIFSSSNKGKECTFSTSKITSGVYKLRLYTKNFIITTKIAVSTSLWLEELNNNVAAANN